MTPVHFTTTDWMGRARCLRHMNGECNAVCLMCEEHVWSSDASDVFICFNCVMLGPPTPDGRDRRHIGKATNE